LPKFPGGFRAGNHFMMASQKVAIYRVIVLSRALEILYVDCAPGKARCCIYGDSGDANRLAFSSST
jgi:hypothetical protein